MDLLCATDTAIGIISLPLMSVIYFDSVASLAWVGQNQLNKHILSWKASWLSTTWREMIQNSSDGSQNPAQYDPDEESDPDPDVPYNYVAE